MSCVPSVLPRYRLSFLLPDALAAFVAPGRHCPCIAGVLLTIHRDALVTIEGNARGAVFEQARRFFRIVVKHRPAFLVSAILHIEERQDMPGFDLVPRKESWEIAVNSDVTFTRDYAPIISTEINYIGQG